MSELDKLATRVNKGVLENADDVLEEFELDEGIQDSTPSDNFIQTISTSRTLDKQPAIDIDLGDIDDMDLDLDDILGSVDLDMEIGDMDFGAFDDLEMDIDVGATGIVGIDQVRVEKSEEDVKEIINYINREIKMYNLVTSSLNEYEKTKYYSVTSHNAKVELDHVQRGGGGVNTRENCNKLKALIAELNAPKISITPQYVQSRLNMIPSELKTNLWDLFERFERESGLEHSIYTEKLEDDQKKLVMTEVSKILGIIEPIVETVEKSLHTNDTAKRNMMGMLSELNPELEPIGDIEAFYEIINVTEITDGETTISETRNYLEISAQLTRIMDGQLTRKETKKYKDTIVIRVPAHATGARMELLTVTHSRVKEMYMEKCKEEGIVPETYILKPLAYKYRNALVTFGSIGDFASFRESVMPQLDGLRSRRGSVNDLTISIVAGKENFEGIYLERYKATTKEFTRYTEREIGKMLEGKEVNKSLQNYIQTPAPFQIERAILHKYDTPCRRYFLGVIEGMPNAKNIEKLFYANKVDICHSYLSVALPYLVNHAKQVLDKLENTDEGLNVTYNVAADIITYGEPVMGFISKHMTNKETGELTSLIDLLNDTELLETITLADLLGMNKTGYAVTNNNRKVVYSKNRPSEFCGTLIESAKALSKINVETDSEIKGKGKSRVENKVIILEGIDNADEHLKYLKAILNSIIETKGIDAKVDLDMIVNEYRNRIKPIKENVPINNAYYMQQRGGILQAVEDRDDSRLDEFKEMVMDINMKRLQNTTSFSEFVDIIKSKEFAEVIGNDVLETVEDLSKEFKIDLAQTLMTAPLIPNSEILLKSYLEALTEEILNNYKEGSLQETIGLPGPTELEAPEVSQYNLGEIGGKVDYTVSELIKGLESGQYPTTIIRDIVALSKLVGNEEQFAKLGGTRSERMIARTLKGTFDNLLTYSALPTIQVGDWDTDILSLFVEEILNQLCVSNIEYALIQDSIALKLFYQNRNVAKRNIEKQLEEYYIEPSELLDEAIDLQNLLYWIEAVQVLPMELHTEVRKDRMIVLEKLKKTLNVKPVNVESQKELDMKKQRSNAYYKLFLDSGNIKYLKDVDRNFVDFELLTRQPTAEPGSIGGEFSTTELVQLYDLEEDLDGKISDYEYVDIILIAEKKNPKIIETLPEPVVRFVEKDTTVSVLDPAVIETLRKDSSFNLNYKSF